MVLLGWAVWGFVALLGGFFAPQEWKKGAYWDARAELALLQPVWGGDDLRLRLKEE